MPGRWQLLCLLWDLFQHWLAELEIFAGIFPAAVHECEHTGTTNSFTPRHGEAAVNADEGWEVEGGACAEQRHSHAEKCWSFCLQALQEESSLP